MVMNVSIVGSGYVGLVTGMGFVKKGNSVTFIDIDKKKIRLINQAKPPIYEEGLEKLMKKYKGRYHATNDYRKSILGTDITFISVGTPTSADSGIDLSYVKAVAQEIGKVLKDKRGYHTIVVKSTVIPGTTEEVVKPILEKFSEKEAVKDFGLAMNPEFLREGVALEDFLHPDRIVIGVQGRKARAVLEKIYKPFKVKKLFVAIKTAEMIKYTANSFLATKISFANEIGNLCKKLGIDTKKVFDGVGLDHRISPDFFQSGAGFGGSCFPKDVKALIKTYKSASDKPRILNAVMAVNDAQPLIMVELLNKHSPKLKNVTIGILGLAFKPKSDDIRESRAIPIVDALLSEGAKVIAYDPLAAENFKLVFPKIEYARSANGLLKKAEMIIIQTAHKEFEDLDYSGKIVIDGRRVKRAERTAKVYEGICW